VGDDEALKAQARAMLVERYGPSCAAWLVGERPRRAKLHRRGQVDVVVPEVDREGKPYEMPMWFSVAVDYLRGRPGWTVDVVRHRGERRFRIRWLGWMQRSRAALPDVLRRT
jgi:hypothetical protein